MTFELFPCPTIFAHRGASAFAPENTLAAFSLALQQGADAIELDAKLTADGVVVVIHDQTVDRTTNGSGVVRQLPLSALSKLDAGSHYDIQFKGEPIPTLESVFEAVGNQTLINVELTNYTSSTDNLPEKVVALVRQFNIEKRVLFSSFNPLSLSRAHRLLPGVPLGLLAFPGAKGAWARSWLNRFIPHNALHPEVNDVTSVLIEHVHRAGRRVHVYTVNQPEQMRHLFSSGVDGIFTDNPLLARRELARLNA